MAVVLAVGAIAFVVGRAAAKPTSPSAFGAPGLPARSAAADFAPLDRSGLAPADVLAAVPVPSEASVLRRAHQAGSAIGTFDASVTYASTAGAAAIRHFFPAALAQRRWRVSSQSNVILATHPSSDGFYWELGVTVSAGRGGPPSGGGPAAGGSRFTLRLLQYDDGS